MSLRARIDALLADPRLNDDGSDPTRAEAVERLFEEFGWEAVRDVMFAVLRDDRRAGDWRAAADFFWGAVLDRRDLSADELIAWLYHRFDPDGTDEDNQVWSIASELKGVDYLSDYQPLQDPGVLGHLRRIRGEAV